MIVHLQPPSPSPSLPVWHFDRYDDKTVEKVVTRENEEDLKPEPEEVILCAQCRNQVTLPDQAMEMDGAHEHHFSNPKGVEFHIGCFKEAEGCASLGERSAYWTWFPGYQWQISVCRKCQNHLGWVFTSSSDGFYGLILDRLLRPRN